MGVCLIYLRHDHVDTFVKTTGRLNGLMNLVHVSQRQNASLAEKNVASAAAALLEQIVSVHSTSKSLSLECSIDNTPESLFMGQMAVNEFIACLPCCEERISVDIQDLVTPERAQQSEQLSHGSLGGKVVDFDDGYFLPWLRAAGHSPFALLNCSIPFASDSSIIPVLGDRSIQNVFEKMVSFSAGMDLVISNLQMCLTRLAEQVNKHVEQK